MQGLRWFCCVVQLVLLQAYRDGDDIGKSTHLSQPHHTLDNYHSNRIAVGSNSLERVKKGSDHKSQPSANTKTKVNVAANHTSSQSVPAMSEWLMRYLPTQLDASEGRPRCSPQTEDELCFGFAGSKCTRIPHNDACPRGQQAVSVGSLTHDTCCRYCKDGFACSHISQGHVFTTAGLSSEKLDDQPCGYEWRKAVWNTFDKRYWCSDQPEGVSHPMTLLKTNREYDIYDHFGKKFEDGRRSVPDIGVTHGMCAPAGTFLDCIGCKDCSGSCTPVPGIGDSQFCCSGAYSVIQSVRRFKKTWIWGKCSGMGEVHTVQ